MSIHKIIAIMVFSFFVCSCSYIHKSSSFIGEVTSENAVLSISEDISSYLSEKYPPGYTSIHIIDANKEEDIFSSSLKNSLRQKGFSILNEHSNENLSLSYIVDTLQKEKDKQAIWYIQIKLSDGKIISRTYTEDGSPEAGRASTQAPESEKI